MTDENVIRVPRVTRTGPCSAVSIWPADETGIATTTFHSLAQPIAPAGRKIRTDITAEELERLAKFGALAFKSAGAIRKR